MLNKVATVFGGSGFVGRYIVQRLAKQGWRVKVASRRPNEAMFTQVYGFPGQVTPMLANIRFPKTIEEAIEGSSAVVNCVGILNQIKQQKFDAIHFKAAENIAKISSQMDVDRLIHMSSLGSTIGSPSEYADSKARGEQVVIDNFEEAIIFRPSVIFGNEDEFFNKFASLARLSIVLPLPGGHTQFQPVFVDDVAQAVEKAVIEDIKPGIYELGGPDQLSLKQLIDRMLEIIRRKRLVLAFPAPLFSPVAWIFDMLQFVSGGLVPNQMITRDQLQQLGQDNVVTGAYPTFAELGITPTSMSGELEKYLYSYRPDGQYTAIKESSDAG